MLGGLSMLHRTFASSNYAIFSVFRNVAKKKKNSAKNFSPFSLKVKATCTKRKTTVITLNRQAGQIFIC